MLNLGGLSAAYPGYQAAEATQATTEQNQLAAKEAMLKLVGDKARERGFIHLLTGQAPPLPGQGPQPPQPGQPSVPAAPQGGGPAPAPMQGGSAPVAAPASPPVPYQPPIQRNAETGQPEVSLQNLTKSILAANPGIQNHPGAFIHALDGAKQYLDRQSQEDLAELRKEMSTQRLKQTGELAQARIDASKAAEAGKQGRFDAREARLAASTAVRQDQSWQRLEQQRLEAERKAQQSGDKTALSQWRAIVDAQHKRATEIIQSNSQMSALGDDEKKALLSEQRAAYDGQIAAMRGKLSQPAGAPPPASAGAPAATAPVPATTTPSPATNAPPLAVLKPNTITTFANGQKWTIGPDGQPKQVP